MPGEASGGMPQAPSPQPTTVRPQQDGQQARAPTPPPVAASPAERSAAYPRVRLERLSVGSSEVTRLRLPDHGPAYQAMHAMLQRRRTELARSSSANGGSGGAAAALGTPTMSLPPEGMAARGGAGGMATAETLLPALSA